MPTYQNAALMLAVTLAGFVLLAKLIQSIRSRGFALPGAGSRFLRQPGTQARLVIEQACAVDGKRRLILVRCDEQRVLLLTGGPADLVVSVMPAALPVNARAIEGAGA